jgi:hypothetical protein
MSDDCDLLSKYLIEIYKNTFKDDTVSLLIWKNDYCIERKVNKCEYLSVFRLYAISVKQLSCIMIKLIKHQI